MLEGKNIHFKAKNFLIIFLLSFAKKIVLTKLIIGFDRFNNFETGHVLYLAKLQNCQHFEGPYS